MACSHGHETSGFQSGWGEGPKGGRQQEPERYLQQILEVLTWQQKCPCGWHLGKRKGVPLYYSEQQRTIKVVAGSGKSLFLLPLPLTLNSELPKCIFTTEAKKLVTKRRDQWLLVAVKVTFGENVHFGGKKCHGDVAGSHCSVMADNWRWVQVLLEVVEMSDLEHHYHPSLNWFLEGRKMCNHKHQACHDGSWNFLRTYN